MLAAAAAHIMGGGALGGGAGGQARQELAREALRHLHGHTGRRHDGVARVEVLHGTALSAAELRSSVRRDLSARSSLPELRIGQAALITATEAIYVRRPPVLGGVNHVRP